MTVRDNLLDRLRGALRSVPRLGPEFRPDRLEIDAEGTLTIEGEVPSVAAKKLALEHVAAFTEVSGLLDRLRVAPAVPMQDAEIRAHLRQGYQQEPSFAALEIAERRDRELDAVRGVPDGYLGRLVIEVDDGVVTLNGQVPGLNSKRLAGVLAWWVPGSRDVVNGLAVRHVDACQHTPDLALSRIQAVGSGLADPMSNERCEVSSTRLCATHRDPEYERHGRSELRSGRTCEA